MNQKEDEEAEADADANYCIQILKNLNSRKSWPRVHRFQLISVDRLPGLPTVLCGNTAPTDLTWQRKETWKSLVKPMI